MRLFLNACRAFRVRMGGWGRNCTHTGDPNKIYNLGDLIQIGNIFAIKHKFGIPLILMSKHVMQHNVSKNIFYVASRIIWFKVQILNLLDCHVWGAMLEKYHKLQPKPNKKIEDCFEVDMGRFTPGTHQPGFTKRLWTCETLYWWWTKWAHVVTLLSLLCNNYLRCDF